MKKYAVNKNITGKSLRHLRNMLGMTQREFAGFASVSVKTIERWESMDTEISGPIAVLAKILKEQPELADLYEIPERQYPLRMWYMFRNEPCTLIDVDEQKQKIRIRNYTDKIQFRAFGVKEHPSFKDYRAFLESRCFPESRDKMKLTLRELDIPFYDPLLIISKTNGRMEEDEFWIHIGELND